MMVELSSQVPCLSLLRLLVVGCFFGVKFRMIVIGLYHKAIVNR